MNWTTRGTPATDPWLAFSVTIDRITEETPGVASYELKFTDPGVEEAYRFRPGQFNMLYVPGVGEAAISVSGPPDSREALVHTIRLAGNVTHAISRLGPGGKLGLRGPFGSGWPVEECLGRDVVIVAGGIGLAPLRPLIYALLSDREKYGALTLLCGARMPDDLLYQHQYPEWRRRGMRVDVTVDRPTRGWEGHVGVVPLLLDRLHLSRLEETVLLVCGPEVMMWYTVRSALERGISKAQIWMNMERNMNCAIGLCGHCQFGPEFICKDGPVLRYDALEPFLRVKDF